MHDFIQYLYFEGVQVFFVNIYVHKMKRIFFVVLPLHDQGLLSSFHAEPVMTITAVVRYDLLELVHKIISDQLNLINHHCSFLGLVL